MEARWTRAYYRSGIYMLAVSVTVTSDTLKMGTPVRLFETPVAGDIEPSPDGQRFLVNAFAESPSLVTILVNWAGGQAR